MNMNNKIIISTVAVILIAAGVYFVLVNKSEQSNNQQTSTNTQPTNQVNPTPTSAQSTSAITNWKTYKSKELGIEFQYPSEWNLEGGVSLNADCFNTNQKGNIVSIALHLPTSGGFFIEGVDKEACTNRGLGYFHYAKSPSEITYKETIKLGNNTFYLDFQRVNPGTHAFHAYLFGDLKTVPSLHFYYNPLILNPEKEYAGNEAEYKIEKELFVKVLSTIKFTN